MRNSELFDRIDKSRVPAHVAIIMDGNGRWAQERNLPRTSGHRAGAKPVRKVLEACMELGVKVLTLYAFSTENWLRPKKEVSMLMSLLYSYLKKEEKTLQREKIRLMTIGDTAKFPAKFYNELERIKETTKGNNKLILNLALNYGGRQEIINAVRKMADSGESATEENLSKHLYTAGLPDPDLLIRTSNELRISNFLLWQVAYTEFYFTGIYWPDFDKEHLYRAVIDYQQRDRRYGGLSVNK